MPNTAGCRTIVLGAGTAGILGAIACVRAGHHVTIVDPDISDRGLTGGSAQDGQLHNLLGRAQRHLVDLVPTFGESFAAAGGQRAAVASQTHVHELGIDMPERDLGLEIWSARKGLVDDVLWCSLAASGLNRPVSARAGPICVESGRIVGVVVGGVVQKADLVIDAMGAKSPLERWLDCGPPPCRRHVVRQWYATMTVLRPARISQPDFWLTFPTPPKTRGGLISPIDAERWNVSVSGGRHDKPPRTPEEFLEFTQTLETATVAGLLAESTPLELRRPFQKPVASWRQYHQMAALPVGLVSMGDAVADLNPLFGQGISVAAWQAAGLTELLAKSSDISRITVQFRQRAAAAAHAAWVLMRVYDDDEGEALTGQGRERLLDAIRRDPDEHRAYVEIWNLLRPASYLRRLAGLDWETSRLGAFR